LGVLFLAAAMALSSCGLSQGAHEVERSVVDGVPTVRTIGGPRRDSPLFRLDTTYVLGVDEEGPEWQRFSATPYLIAAPDGWAVLADRRSFQVYIVSPEGQLHRAIGRQGAGPGEFQRIAGLHWAEVGQEFWIEDHRLMRVSRFSMGGDLLGSFSISEARAVNAFFISLGGRQFLGTIGDREDNQSYSRWWLAGPELHVAEPFMSIPDTRSFWRGSAGIPMPYTSMTSLHASPFGRFVIADPNEGWLQVCSTDAKPLLRMERDWPRESVSAGEKQSLRTGWREGGSSMWGEYWNEIPIPDIKPAFSEVHIDDQHRTWVARYHGPQIWSARDSLTTDVFSADGVWIGFQVFPHNMPLVVGCHAYLRYTSEAGAPRVAKLELLSNEGGS
jgi:hypothetical protein